MSVSKAPASARDVNMAMAVNIAKIVSLLSAFSYIVQIKIFFLFFDALIDWLIDWLIGWIVRVLRRIGNISVM